MENESIEKMKILILYGKRPVNGKNRDGEIEKIEKDEEDVAHYFYMKSFLNENMKDEKDLQKVVENRSINELCYEMQKIGHIVFTESTSKKQNKLGILYMPKEISNKQKESLKSLKNQLLKEKYTVMMLYKFQRDKDGALSGMQKIGSPVILNEFIQEEQER